MKNYKIYLPFVAVAIFGIFFLIWNKENGQSNQAEMVSGKDRQNQRSTTITYRENRKINRPQNQVLKSKGGDFVRECHQAAAENDAERFRLAVTELIRLKKEDPRSFLEELIPYLDHPNKHLRFELARRFLWTNTAKEKTKQTLLAFVEDQNEKPILKTSSTLNEQYIEDFRKSAAKLLTTYRIAESKDALWKAYQQTKDKIYLNYLMVFRDERVLSVVQEQIKKTKKYHEHYKILGMFKVVESKESLESFYKNLENPHPFTGRMDGRKKELTWALYQITKDQKYYDYLVEEKFYVNNTFFEVPNVLSLLENMLRADDGFDPNARGDKAFLSLLAREDGREVIENYLVEVFDEKIKTPVDVTTRYQVAAYLESDLVNAAAQRYEDKYSNGFWPYYSKRKGWPINDLLDGFDY